MSRRLVPVAFVSLLVGFGCSSKGPQTSSETHFNTCTTDAKCVALYGANYSCVQNVCRETFVDGGAGGSGGSSPLVDSGPSTEPGTGGSAGSVDSGGAPDTDACAAGTCDANCVANVPTALVNLFGGADSGSAPRASWTTVRLDFTTYRVLGFQYGATGADAGATLDQAGALSRAVTDTGFGADTGFPSDAKLLSGATPDDEWIFEKSPGDFGEVAAVSVGTGQTAFGATIVFAGHGDIAYPKTWRSPDELGRSCSFATKPPAQAFDLSESQSGAPLSTASSHALDVVWQTALPEALPEAGQTATSAVVILYPRSVGAFVPTAAEWIVIVNAASQ